MLPPNFPYQQQSGYPPPLQPAHPVAYQSWEQYQHGRHPSTAGSTQPTTQCFNLQTSEYQPTLQNGVSYITWQLQQEQTFNQPSTGNMQLWNSHPYPAQQSSQDQYLQRASSAWVAYQDSSQWYSQHAQYDYSQSQYPNMQQTPGSLMSPQTPRQYSSFPNETIPYPVHQGMFAHSYNYNRGPLPANLFFNTNQGLGIQLRAPQSSHQSPYRATITPIMTNSQPSRSILAPLIYDQRVSSAQMHHNSKCNTPYSAPLVEHNPPPAPVSPPPPHPTLLPLPEPSTKLFTPVVKKENVKIKEESVATLVELVSRLEAHPAKPKTVVKFPKDGFNMLAASGLPEEREEWVPKVKTEPKDNSPVPIPPSHPLSDIPAQEQHHSPNMAAAEKKLNTVYIPTIAEFTTSREAPIKPAVSSFTDDTIPSMNARNELPIKESTQTMPKPSTNNQTKLFIRPGKITITASTMSPFPRMRNKPIEKKLVHVQSSRQSLGLDYLKSSSDEEHSYHAVEDASRVALKVDDTRSYAQKLAEIKSRLASLQKRVFEKTITVAPTIGSLDSSVSGIQDHQNSSSMTTANLVPTKDDTLPAYSGNEIGPTSSEPLDIKSTHLKAADTNTKLVDFRAGVFGKAVDSSSQVASTDHAIPDVQARHNSASTTIGNMDPDMEDFIAATSQNGVTLYDPDPDDFFAATSSVDYDTADSDLEDFLVATRESGLHSASPRPVFQTPVANKSQRPSMLRPYFENSGAAASSRTKMSASKIQISNVEMLPAFTGCGISQDIETGSSAEEGEIINMDMESMLATPKRDILRDPVADRVRSRNIAWSPSVSPSPPRKKLRIEKTSSPYLLTDMGMEDTEIVEVSGRLTEPGPAKSLQIESLAPKRKRTRRGARGPRSKKTRSELDIFSNTDTADSFA